MTIKIEMIMSEKTHEDQLYKIFGNVNDWLKFAETKNAMIIGFNGASIYGLIRAFNIDYIKNSSCIQCYLLLVIILLIISTVFSLISFVPKVKIIEGGLYNSGNTPNVLFFEYLKTKSNIEIIQEITGITDESKFTRLEKDIA